MVTPGELLQFARELADSPHETAWRASISRAYYAAFLHLRQHMVESSKLAKSRSGQDHGRVYRVLFLEDEAAAAWLDFLRRRRNEADYDIDASTNRAVVDIALVAAQSLLDYPQKT